MNSPLKNETSIKSPAEETLRLIAKLPPPAGLVDRMQAGLRAAPRTNHLLHWPSPVFASHGWMGSNVLRGAAAAAIVCVVAGGGWGIYSRTPAAPTPAAKVVAQPARVGSSGGFSTAGAMHTPETLKGPVLTHSVKPQPTSAVIPPAPTSLKASNTAKSGKAKKTSPRVPAQ